MAVLKADHLSETNDGMQVKTILNRIQKQRGFVYGDVRFDRLDGGLVLTVDLYPHARNRPACADCGQRGQHNDQSLAIIASEQKIVDVGAAAGHSAAHAKRVAGGCGASLRPVHA